MPTILASYTTGKWSFSGFFGIPGGGGNAKFNDGLPAFDAMGGALVAAQGMTATSAFESTQYVFALQLGAAYRISNNWSVYAGIRGNYITANYSGDSNAPALLTEPSLAGEDFSFYQKCVPAVFFFLGLGPSPELHAADFDFDDETILPSGVDFLKKLLFLD